MLMMLVLVLIVKMTADCEDDAYELYLTSKQVMAEGGLNLRKYITNSAILQQRINDKERDAKLNTERGQIKEDKTYTKHLLGGSLSSKIMNRRS